LKVFLVPKEVKMADREQKRELAGKIGKGKANFIRHLQTT
jgi:hypothetical protein